MTSTAQVSADTVRRQIEAALERRIPAALTPVARARNAVHATGIGALDGLTGGGLLEGALSELVGPECSGRTAVALAFGAGMTRVGKVCAWVDVTDALDPVSAAAAGVDLKRLLWVRCGVSGEAVKSRRFEFKVPEQYFVPPAVKKGLQGGGFGGHPRGEVRGMAVGVGAPGVGCVERVSDQMGGAVIRTNCEPPSTPMREHSRATTRDTPPFHDETVKGWATQFVGKGKNRGNSKGNSKSKAGSSLRSE